MGEEEKQEKAKVETQQEKLKEDGKQDAENKEEKTGKKQDEKPGEKLEENPLEEKKEEISTPPEPPPPFVLSVNLHCVGCAKKIQRSIMRIRGVERVVIDMTQNQIMIKGIIAPKAVCDKIMKKTKRRAKVLSPPLEAEGEPIPQVVFSQVAELTTVELKVRMHCQTCAVQLKKKIMKMRGVQIVEAELSSGKVIVVGTMDENKLVEYVYRHTKKQAKIISQLEPEQEQPEIKKEEEKSLVDDDAKPEQKQEIKETIEQKEEEKHIEEENKEKEGENKGDIVDNKGNDNNSQNNKDEESIKKFIYYYQPMYVIEQIPPPQIFSDENPNACVIL